MEFNISFMTNPYSFIAFDLATLTLSKMMAISDSANTATESASKPRTLAHRWLFPDPLDVLLDPPSPTLGLNASRPWVDNGLNYEQKTAAATISQYSSAIPYLISGPPGTGKTRTVVETVYQILLAVPNAHVLLCAPSNSATDTLALRLAQGGYLKPQELLRLNHRDRTFAEVPDAITSFCYIEDDKFGLPPLATLMRYRVVVTCCLDADILVQAKCTNLALAALEVSMMNSLYPTKPRHRVMQPHWTHLLVDEAAQASEPEVGIPISVVLTNDTFAQTEGTDQNGARKTPCSVLPQLCLCGDPNQLGPIVTSVDARNNELDVSLLERLFERPVYADHPLARSKFSDFAREQPTNFDEPGMIKCNKSLVPFTNLLKNYRSHPAILMPPSAMFYNDSLEPCAINGSISWSGIPNPQLPLIFIGCDGKEQCVDERATWFNPSEIARVVETILSLLSEGSKCSPPLQASEIGVMAPWREQVWQLRAKLREHKLSAVDVGSVEDYQGRESRVIIISAVRSSERFVDEDTDKGQGLIFERKRMNVAITRAKELLIVIGNPMLLKRDPYWQSFLQFVKRHNLYVGPSLELEMDGNYISRLESQFIHDAELDEEDLGVFIAGGVAREILREGS
ncbi:P-loop containing nucleoside triphosphate hydrolase protein [Mycena floridula]|nr:P-loop containing nucleoside triphosphate hydrolase protein [Mycena floridula]